VNAPAGIPKSDDAHVLLRTPAAGPGDLSKMACVLLSRYFLDMCAR
jgi:hypothetical protein